MAKKQSIEVVINTCVGSFSLSEKAYNFLGLKWDDYGFAYSRNDKKRSDPKLVECVKKLGKKANGRSAHLKIIKIPENIEWHIENFNGIEFIYEDRRSWS